MIPAESGPAPDPARSIAFWGIVALARAGQARRRRSAVIASSGGRRDAHVVNTSPFDGRYIDRLTHRCHIFEMNGESYRFKESMKAKKDKDPKKGK